MKNMVIMIALFAFVTSKAQPSTISTPDYTDASAVVGDFFKAFKAKDHAKVNSLLHPEVVWIQPGSNRISGVKRSRQEVLDMGKQMSELSAKTIELADVRVLNATANTVACILQWKAVQPTGAKLNVINVDVYTVENGTIVNGRVYSEDIVQEDKFWGR